MGDKEAGVENKMTYVTVERGEHIFKMDKALVDNLMELKRLNDEDWDFKFIISGDGMTRTGKTTIGGQVGIFFDTSCTEKNWCYQGDLLIAQARKLGYKRVVIYDEAKEGLDSKKSMSRYCQHIVDYMNECGYLNQYLIIILPDYFNLVKEVALSLSICLINVHLDSQFKRGHYDFYDHVDKRMLFIRGKKFHNYSSHPPSFGGNFQDYLPFDSNELRKLKEAAIKSRDERQNKLSKMEKKYRARWLRVICYLYQVGRWTQKQIADVSSSDLDKITHKQISQVLDSIIPQK